MTKGKFEEAYAELERIIRALEGGETSLDESLEYYEKGVAALKTCHRILEEAEKKIEILVKDSQGELHEESFSVDKTQGEATG
ncbi:MAG: exodeoxyribonuclease VII small subunit [Planctomycetota bacterium]|nr:exodeoxyribonuclease VII small subunit [Planctomycetota bacterium]MCZ6690421.1 exodeoxyribonuclease VII small subunit [Planctomycetota bacterium]